MIHSLAGGEIRDKEYFTCVLVEMSAGAEKKLFWYKATINGIIEGDEVIVPLGANNARIQGVVKRVVKNVTNDRSPVPVNRLKEIIKIVKKTQKK